MPLRLLILIVFQKLIDGVCLDTLLDCLCIGIQIRLCIRWSRNLSEHFGVMNGVRQGCILSPCLYNICMDDLTTALNKCDTGRIIGNANIKH